MFIASQLKIRNVGHLICLFAIALILTVFICPEAYAQEEEGTTTNKAEEGTTTNEAEEGTTVNKAEEAAKNLANPNATIGFLTFPTDLIFYDGDLPDASSQSAFKMNFQPSLPYNTGPGTNLFVRPLIPVIFQQPV